MAILSLLVFSLVSMQSVKALPVVWQDDFESLDFSLWSWTTVSDGCLLEITNINPYEGVFAAHSITQLSSDYAYSAMNFSGYGPIITVDPLYVRAYFYLDELNLVDETWIELINIIGGPAGADAYTYSTSVRVVNDLGTLRWSLATIENNITDSSYGAQTVQTGRYYCVESLRDVAHGVQMLWIDGQLEVSTETAMTNPSWEVKLGICWVGRSGSQTVGTCEVRYDDVIISDYRIPQTSVFNVIVDENSYPVSIVSNSTVSDFVFSQEDKSISFNVTGITGVNGFSNMTFPIQLLTGPYVILVDGSPVSATVTANETHTSVYLTYSHSSHIIETIGTTVVPEFPTIIANMLVLTAMALMLLAAKKSLTRHKVLDL